MQLDTGYVCNLAVYENTIYLRYRTSHSSILINYNYILTYYTISDILMLSNIFYFNYRPTQLQLNNFIFVIINIIFSTL